MTLPVSNSFEGGTAGVRIIAASSGGTSGSAFDVIGQANTNEQYSTTAMHGSLGFESSCGSTAQPAYVQWSLASLGTISAVSYGRAYINISTLTGITGDAIISFLNSGTVNGGIQLGGVTAGKLNFQNQAFAQTNTFTTTLSVNTWYRLEWQVTPGASAAGRLVAHLYVGDATTALETQTSTTGVYGGSTSWNAIRFGWGSAGANHASQPSLYFDDLNVNSTGLPGPAVSNATPSDTDASSADDSVASVTAALSSLDLSSSIDSTGTVTAHSAGTDTSGTTAEAAGTVAATVPASDSSGTTADAGTVRANVSSSDASNAAADGGQVVVFRSDTDASSATADASGPLKLSAAEASGTTADSSSIVARFSDTDASGTASDGQQAGSRVTDSDASGTTADTQASSMRVIAAAAETSVAADISTRTSLSATDASGITADTSGALKLSSSDASGATAEALKAVRVSDTEISTSADSGFISGGSTAKSDTDTGHGEDSGWTYISSTDTGHGTDAGERPGPVGTDTGHGTDIELTRFVSDTDLSKSVEAGFWSGTIRDSDSSGPATDAGETVAVQDTEFSVTTDTYVPVIDVYTYEATFMIAQPGGGFLLVHYHPVTGERRVILAVDHIDGPTLKLARQIAQSRTVEFVSDRDYGQSGEYEESTVGVRVSVQRAVEVTAELMWQPCPGVRRSTRP
jgi:hypothetical protein